MVNRIVRIVIILGMVAVMCVAVDAEVKPGVETQAGSVGEYPVCTAPCECITERTAAMRWGAQGYEKCSKTICGQDAGGDIQYYCIHQAGSAVSVSKSVPSVTLAPMTTASAATTITVTMVQETTVNALGTSREPATPGSTWPAAHAVPQKTPLALTTVLAAVCVALLAVDRMRRK